MMRILSIAARLACLAVIAYLLAEGVFLFCAPPRPFDHLLAGGGRSGPGGRTTVETPPLSLYDSICARNLFGARNGPDGPGELDLDALPESRLGWKLLGTVMSGDPALRRVAALINGKNEIFRENDEVNQWTITRIERGAVVLARDGTVEVLRMEAGALPVAAASVFPDEASRRVDRGTIRERLRDMPSLARDVSMSPAAVGADRGMRITALREGSLMAELGLAKDDVLLSANAAPIASFADLTALANLVEGPLMELTVLRNNKKVSLRYEINE